MTGNEQEILNRLIECERLLMQLLTEIRILDERLRLAEQTNRLLTAGVS